MSSSKTPEVIVIDETDSDMEDKEMTDADAESESGSEEDDECHLLSLPPEILQMILYHMDTGALLTVGTYQHRSTGTPL